MGVPRVAPAMAPSLVKFKIVKMSDEEDRGSESRRTKNVDLRPTREDGTPGAPDSRSIPYLTLNTGRLLLTAVP